MTVFAVYVVVDVVGDRAHERRQAELAEVATLPGGLIDDLQNERNMSSLTLTGLEDLVTLSVETVEEAREAVDSSTAVFEEVIGNNEPAAAAYEEAMDALSELDAIRVAVDQDEGPRTLENLEGVLRIYDRYSEVIAAFMDGTTRLVVAFDQGELRRGVKLIDLTSRQIEAATVLGTRLVFAAVEHGPRLVDDRGDPVDRELVAEIRWLSGDLRRRRTEIAELATGAYAAATTTALRETVEVGLDDLVTSVLEGGTYSVDGLLETVEEDPNSGYRGLLKAFEAILSESGA